ncbi:MAG: hypothetical protein CO093_04765 [Alphaproteobacteria bacterium CG_4_9_14_3_um_filter_47_13]|nr:MAG: hypothetical protein CO093_04765 [Alphaproteobacteria bacterium CG_4_9_14_3_um_filter_47_13]
MLNAGHAVQKVTRKLVFKKMLAFLVIGFGAGALLFIAFPLWLDQIVPYNKEIFDPSLFVYCFLIFLNIHHYFIDFALWRRDNPEMKYLHR